MNDTLVIGGTWDGERVPWTEAVIYLDDNQVYIRLTLNLYHETFHLYAPQDLPLRQVMHKLFSGYLCDCDLNNNENNNRC